MSYILTNGANYVIKNPYNSNEFMISTSSVQAAEFDYKRAKSLLQNPRGKIRHIKNDGYYMVNVETKEEDRQSIHKKGNGGAFIGKNDIEFDETILDEVVNEAISILELSGWSKEQLDIYKTKLVSALSKYDSAESDVEHALQKYREDNNGKKPQAHKMAKLGYLLDDIRDKHKRIKQCLNYIQVMQDAITYHYNIERLKSEISKAKHVEYQGRTEFYQIALDLLN